MMAALRCFVRFSLHEISFFCQTYSVKNLFHYLSYQRLYHFFSISKVIFNPWALCSGLALVSYGGLQIPQFFWIITPDMTESRCLEDIFALPTQWADLLFYHWGVIEITTGVSAGRKITYRCWGTLTEFLPALCHLEARESRKDCYMCCLLGKAVNRYSLSPSSPLKRSHKCSCQLKCEVYSRMCVGMCMYVYI